MRTANAPTAAHSAEGDSGTGHFDPAAASDLALVRHAQQGDSAAFDALVRKYRPRLITLAARYTHNASDAEDATQEALVKAYRGLAEFRGDCAFYTWLYRITVNSAKNLLQMRARAHAMEGSGLADEALDSASQGRDLETPERLT